MKLLDNSRGNYRFLTGIAPYSAGVVAMPGYEITHITLYNPLPYRQGFELIDQYLSEQNRPRQALCGIELRSPRPFTFEGFAGFNQDYQQLLVDWDILVNGLNPVARTNVAPAAAAPVEPVLYGFAYTTPNPGLDAPTFVIAGAGDLVEQQLSPEAIIRAGDTSAQAMREKATAVMQTMQARLSGLQVEWSGVTAVDIYTVQSLQPFLVSVILERMGQTAVHGIHWFYSRPPIIGLEFEMDMRGVRREIRIG